MEQDLKLRLRDAVMDTFRKWGGQWNVTPVPPGTGDAPDHSWLLRVHSRPIARGNLSAELARAYLSDPSDPDVAARWEEELRSTFQVAREGAESLR